MSQLRAFSWGFGVFLIVVSMFLGVLWWKTKNAAYEPVCFFLATGGGLLIVVSAAA